MKATMASVWLAVLLLASAFLAAAAADQRARPSETGEGCAGAEDIAIYQVKASPLPSGVPAYKVDVTVADLGFYYRGMPCPTWHTLWVRPWDVMNQCVGAGEQGCAIAGIHVRCGFFSSVSLVDPRVFRRLRHDDCLVNDGRPLLGGETVSFEYANSFPYQFPVSAATCVRP